MEVLEDFSGPNDRMIVKGKRSKRVRPSSSASSSGGGGGEFNHNSLVSSSTTTSTSTEEDEDMAHCLILLARGGGFLPKAEEENKAAESKFNSRKFTEIATAANGKVDVFVYECKTCGRTFPSFQALGGHRASHKKPKPSSDHVDQKKSPTAASPPRPEDDRQHEQEGKITKLDAAAPPRPTQLVEINKPKLHECSICGSEFASGQALGGHMRRHRPVTTTRSANDSSSQDVGEKTRNVLALDLNLPAPPEDERQDTKFHRLSSNQQSHLVISAAAMVDCHY